MTAQLYAFPQTEAQDQTGDSGASRTDETGAGSSSGGEQLGPLVSRAIATVTGEAASPKGRDQAIDIRALYPATAESPSDLSSALSLFAECHGYFEDALDYLNGGDAIAADMEMQHVNAMLPELFCLRSLGDGYGAVVAALIDSFENKRGLPFTLEQVQEMFSAFRKIEHEPFLSMERAVDIVDSLAEKGLETVPAELEEVMAAFEQQGVY